MKTSEEQGHLQFFWNDERSLYQFNYVMSNILLGILCSFLVDILVDIITGDIVVANLAAILVDITGDIVIANLAAILVDITGDIVVANLAVILKNNEVLCNKNWIPVFGRIWQILHSESDSFSSFPGFKYTSLQSWNSSG